MILPNSTVEIELNSQKIFAIGVDEVGRGPLAGSVVASASRIHPDMIEKEFENRALVRDSKTLSEKQREKIFKFMDESESFMFGLGEVSHYMVDRINILNATMLAMRLAVEDLLWKLKIKENDRVCVLVDGNKKIPGINCDQRLFSKGDRRIFSISAASVFAKVSRDREMKKAHEKFPEYGFASHKGYGTKKHIQQIQKNGPCEIHRRSFGPVRDVIERNS